jgi:SAM-dependent methyltransferase
MSHLDNAGRRLDRERAYHNGQFAGGNRRQNQAKYYWCLEHANNVFIEEVTRLAVGADVLEYGCGIDVNSIAKIAPLARSVAGIDISEVAIADLRTKVKFNNVDLAVMDAMDMSFQEDSFDLIFGTGIVHHLDTESSAAELSRVLRPNGTALFLEPLGVNPVINAYRKRTPGARTPDEHPLVRADFRTFGQHFSAVNVRYFALGTLAALPFRSSAFGDAVRKLLITVDDCVLRIPGIGLLAWCALITCRVPRKPSVH